MKIHTNTPDLFVAGRRAIGCAIPSIVAALLIIWAMLYIIGADEGIPNKIFALVFFGIFVLFFLAMGLPSVFRNQLVLNRPAGRAELRLATFGGYKRTPFELAHVARAELTRDRATIGPSNARSSYSHVSLIVDQGMDAGTYQITRLVISRKDAQALADAINNWLSP